MSNHDDENVDPITLEPVPPKYLIRLNTKAYDARALQLAMDRMGYHQVPHSRRNLRPTEIQEIRRLAAHDELVARQRTPGRPGTPRASRASRRLQHIARYIAHGTPPSEDDLHFLVGVLYTPPSQRRVPYIQGRWRTTDRRTFAEYEWGHMDLTFAHDMMDRLRRLPLPELLQKLGDAHI
jgi:hypothetical protein